MLVLPQQDRDSRCACLPAAYPGRHATAVLVKAMASTQAIRMVAVYALAASVAVCCFPMLALGAHPTVATIHNNVPRVDTAGNIVNAHDGSIIRHNGTFYMYGTVYELCHQPGPQCHVPCGYNPNRFGQTHRHLRARCHLSCYCSSR